jgi:hypothetical protein
MSTLDIYEQKRKPGTVSKEIREQLLQHSKDFKTSWVKLGQALYAAWHDKLFYNWGYDKFEHYTQKELGIKNPTAMKLLKTYFFLEQEEPSYLKEEFCEEREAKQVPGCDAINVLRLAKRNKELTAEDFHALKTSVFDKGRDAALVRKDLTQIMKERKPVDPDEERQKRHEAAVNRLLTALSSFEKDEETLKIAPAELVKEAKALKKKLESQVK